MTNHNEREKEVAITLEKWQVEKLLGAARMGIWAEDLLLSLRYAATGQTDTYFDEWILNVGYAINQIKKQTGVDYEDNDYAESAGYVEKIVELVSNQCKEWRREREEAERKEYEELEK